MADKVIFGFIGPMAAGKGTACQYLMQKYNAGYVRFSSILRDILARVYIPENRENLQAISTAMRQTFGDDLLAKATANDVQGLNSAIVAVDGVRRLPDIKHLVELPNFHLVAIDADIKTRHERITMRRENPDDANKTFEQFKADNEREAEQQIANLMQQADIKIDNNGTLEDLYRQLDEVVKNSHSH